MTKPQDIQGAAPGSSPEATGEASDLLAKRPQPVIMHFKVTGVLPISTPAELKRWEATVRNQVGLPVVIGSDTGSDSRTPSDTISAMSEGPVVDDCDYD